MAIDVRKSIDSSELTLSFFLLESPPSSLSLSFSQLSDLSSTLFQNTVGTQLLSAPSTPVTAQQSHFRTGESSPEAQEILSDFETAQETQPTTRPIRHRNWVPYLSQQNRYHEDVWGH